MERDVSKKLGNLLKLQEIDSKIFDLKNIRGALPQEVQDLEDELEGYNTRLNNHKKEMETLNQDIDDFKNKITEAKKLIKKYKSQQLNVRNNREYDAISKEIEVNDLDLKIITTCSPFFLTFTEFIFLIGDLAEQDDALNVEKS